MCLTKPHEILEDHLQWLKNNPYQAFEFNHALRNAPNQKADKMKWCNDAPDLNYLPRKGLDISALKDYMNAHYANLAMLKKKSDDKPLAEEAYRPALMRFLEDPKHCNIVYELMKNATDTAERKTPQALAAEFSLLLSCLDKANSANQAETEKGYWLAFPTEGGCHSGTIFLPEKFDFIGQIVKYKEGPVIKVTSDEIQRACPGERVVSGDYEFQLVQWRILNDDDDKWQNSHITLKAPKNGAGVLHKYQETCEDFSKVDWAKAEINHSVYLPYNRETGKLALLSFDFDNTLVNVNSELANTNYGLTGMQFLHKKEVVTDDLCTTFTPLGKILYNLKIPFIVTTSRTEQPGLREAIMSRFPSCNGVSFGKPIKEDNQIVRNEKKAGCKADRLSERGVAIHFDDEPNVIKAAGECGVPGVLVDGDKTSYYETTHHLRKQPLVVGLQSLPGIGKSTLIEWIAQQQKCNKKNVLVLATDDFPTGDSYSKIKGIIRADGHKYDLVIVDSCFTSGTRMCPFPVELVRLTSGDPFVDLVFSIVGVLSRKTHQNLCPHPSFWGESELPSEDPQDLVDLVNCCKTFEEIERRLGRIGVDVKRVKHINETTAIICSYQQRSRNWKSRAMRQARNPILVWSDTGKKWLLLSNQLIRGAEALWSQILGNSTENLDSGKDILIFDKSMRKVMWALLGSNTWDFKNAILTAKADGECMGFGLVLANSELGQLVKQCINDPSQIFAQTINNMVQEYFPGYVGYIRSNGTFLAPPEMLQVFLTAISEDKPFEQKGTVEETMHAMMKLLLPSFMKKLSTFLNNIPEKFKNSTMTFTFEAICKGRQTHPVFHFQNTEKKTQLAQEYKESMLLYLGHSRSDGHRNPHYIPHCAPEIQKFVQMSNLPDPAFITVHSADHVNEIMELQQQLICGVITKAQFIDLAKFNPGAIHAEGFVLLTRDKKKSSWEYSKVKTRLYYLYHNKINVNNISNVLENLTPAVGKYFPLADMLLKQLGDGSKPGTLLPVLICMCNNFYAYYAKQCQEMMKFCHKGLVFKKNNDGYNKSLKAVRDEQPREGLFSSISPEEFLSFLGELMKMKGNQPMKGNQSSIMRFRDLYARHQILQQMLNQDIQLPELDSSLSPKVLQGTPAAKIVHLLWKILSMTEGKNVQDCLNSLYQYEFSNEALQKHKRAAELSRHRVLEPQQKTELNNLNKDSSTIFWELSIELATIGSTTHITKGDA